ncbi:uncharacterized protein I303_105912 [Kwoniella dejecticola CBS 10117]|uniref:Uncharacterized protein n=1 Tax=Kwoniella dejecticola CBS 10117 TaxID=1296121 RepID=A0A1A6A0S2_9TREE|nr:uncharacterized protein I303_05934 [Kwoniella dejecticola CBS 10117]OBR83654.1 hypothetical protein I303_05934 [Kwoniella dejecticola CBS 10117]
MPLYAESITRSSIREDTSSITSISQSDANSTDTNTGKYDTFKPPTVLVTVKQDEDGEPVITCTGILGPNATYRSQEDFEAYESQCKDELLELRSNKKIFSQLKDLSLEKVISFYQDTLDQAPESKFSDDYQALVGNYDHINERWNDFANAIKRFKDDKEFNGLVVLGIESHWQGSVDDDHKRLTSKCGQLNHS